MLAHAAPQTIGSHRYREAEEQCGQAEAADRTNDRALAPQDGNERAGHEERLRYEPSDPIEHPRNGEHAGTAGNERQKDDCRGPERQHKEVSIAGSLTSDRRKQSDDTDERDWPEDCARADDHVRRIGRKESVEREVRTHDRVVSDCDRDLSTSKPAAKPERLPRG
jgi:hypothetical protein